MFDLARQMSCIRVAFVFEEPSRQWVTEEGRTDKLPLAVQEVGSHWIRSVQVDVVAVNRADRAILVGRGAVGGPGDVGRGPETDTDIPQAT